MDRRQFVKVLTLGGLAANSVLAAPAMADFGADVAGDIVKDYLTKIKNFNHTFKDDVILTGDKLHTLKRVASRLRKVQSYVGYANFSLISFDDALDVGSSYSAVGEFSKEEKAFIEFMFYTKASDYGFFGEKVLTELTQTIPERDLIKIARTGHYIYRGDSQRLYLKIRRDIGSNVTLTSGVRGVIKQLDLFVNKAIESDGNLSMASRSLAPPGHSYHGIGDFDVGKVGYGPRNFTEDFARTDEFKRLTDLGYIRIRYDETNPYGVRYEPWHIKVV